jgi:hypothetical protein
MTVRVAQRRSGYPCFNLVTPYFHERSESIKYALRGLTFGPQRRAVSALMLPKDAIEFRRGASVSLNLKSIADVLAICCSLSGTTSALGLVGMPISRRLGVITQVREDYAADRLPKRSVSILV